MAVDDVKKVEEEYYESLRGKKGGGTIIVILAFLLFLFDTVVGYKGFNITNFGSISGFIGFLSSLGWVLGIGAGFYYFSTKDKSTRNMLSFIMVMIILIITIVMLAKFDRTPILHVIFILAFWALFIKQREDTATANWILIGFLFADLYLYSIIAAFSATAASYLIGIPILFYLTLGFVSQKTNNRLALFLIFGVLFWYLLTTGPGITEGLGEIRAVQQQLPSIQDFPSLAYNRLFVEPYEKASTGISSWLETRIKYAITGKVEENRYEQLGVYLEDVKPAEPKFYTDEDIVIWGSLKARTLDDVINVNVGCFLTEGNKKIPADTAEPDKTFSIFTLEEQDFICKFNEDNENIKVGSNAITAFAEFNFDTLAYLKTYFIDRERLRAMTRENLDPFEEFEIEDKSPVAIYTNGPVGIDMSTTTPLIGVSDESLTYPRLNINLVNRPGWEGRINQIKEFVVWMPKGLTITSPETDCTRPFKKYEIGDCRTSCEKFVKEPCLNVCDQLKEEGKDSSECVSSCNENLEDRCKPECDNLFNEGGEKYNAYTLNVEEIQQAREDELSDIERFRSFSCRLNPNTGQLLGNTPITTKFFRARARYNYSVEKKISVTVERPPDYSERLGGASLIVGGDIGRFMIKQATGKIDDPIMIPAIAYKESLFKHCCEESGRNDANCDGTTEVKCDKDRIITTYDGGNPESVGIMQINIKDAGEVERLENSYCNNDEDVYNIYCNIKIGIGILKKKYDDDKDGRVYCGGTDNEITYTGWDAALRGYNGWGCGINPNYVDDVKGMMERMKDRNRADSINIAGIG